jgi:hypothetical protein
MLSSRSAQALSNAIADIQAADEVVAAIDAAAALAPAADVPAISTANATDLPSAEALANSCKSTINEILANMKAAGLME